MWFFNSWVCRCAINTPIVTRLRCLRSSPSRDQTLPKANCVASRATSAPNPPSRIVARNCSALPSPISSEKTWSPCSVNSTMPTPQPTLRNNQRRSLCLPCDRSDRVIVHAIPELIPASEVAWQIRCTISGRCPVLERRSRPIKNVVRVPVLFLPPFEVPVPIAADIEIEVDDRHDDPLVAVLVLGTSIGGSGSGIVIDEVDHVAADLVDRSVERPQVRLDEAAQDFAPPAQPPAIDVLDEQVQP